MIRLFQPPPVWGVPSMSPFCVKLETYLKMAKIPYETPAFDFRKAPKGKVPFVEMDGKLLGDSTLIIKELKKKFGDRLDSSLSAEQKAQALAIQALIEEHFYFAGAYLRWTRPESLPYVREVFLSFLPPVIGKFIFKKIHKDFMANIKAQGMGRHSPEEIAEFAKEDLRTLSDLLGGKPFFMGDNPTSLDASAYGFLVQQYYVPWRGPTRDFAESLPNLKAYVERMKARYWT